MRSRSALGVLAGAAFAIGFTTFADAQYVEVPTFLAGTPTFAPYLQEIDVAVGTDGNVAIVWGEFGAHPGLASRVVARSFSPSGVALGPPNRVDTSGGAFWPELVADDTGGYVVGWKYTPDGIGGWLYSRRLDAQARGVASEVRVDKPNFGPVVEHDLTYLPSGPVYLWVQNGFWSRRYNEVSQPLESAAQIGNNFPGFHAATAALPDGGFVVVWADTWQAQYSWARTYFADGQPRGAAFAIDAIGLVDRVAAGPNGDIVAVGGQTGDVWMRRFRANGTFVGARQVVRALPADTYAEADAAFDSRGNVLVVWSEFTLGSGLLQAPRMRAYDAARVALGPDVALSDVPAGAVRTARLHDDCFVNAFYSQSRAYGNVVCLCSSSSSGCGDGTLDGQCELCDDGNTTSGDGCDSNCTPSGCGNGIVGGDETCDDGNRADGDGCDANCTITRCGNGVVTQNEQCDDGNPTDGDGCESNCTITGCGNKILTAGEECDDGNHADGDGCDSNCTRTRCGNKITAPPETCDDGNSENGDGCDANCTTTGCGNEILTAGEECDDGNRASADRCDAQCLTESCGNERIEGNEQCDDGNTTAGDGCEGDCTLPDVHDSVLFALDPLDIALDRGTETTTRELILQVQNADVLPKRESPGHVMRLTGSDGDCPPGTLSAMPDFESGMGGVQDTVQVDGGLPATAHARITVSRKTFAPFDRRVPERCTLWFAVAGVPEGLYDPTPDNNVVALELNVYDSDAAIGQGEDEIFVQSLRPTTVKIPSGQTSVVEQVKPTVRRAGKKELEDAGLDVIVTAGDGDCPKGTIGVADFDRRAAGTQNRMLLRRGKRARGVIALVVRSDLFTSTTDESPRRCTAVLTISGERDIDPSNNTTRLVIDVLDRNDY